jgi:hypothetical protein
MARPDEGARGLAYCRPIEVPREEVAVAQEQAQRFYEERLPPAIEKAIGMVPVDPPVSTAYELHAVITP